jgi:thymidylate kinase
MNGRLIAIDGTVSAALRAAARALRADGYKGARLSEWDASQVFSELAEANDQSVPSARVLLLLYATDLAYRLKTEIRPALAEDRIVIAAPYVRTALAFGRAAGLRGEWLQNLFSFAPPADESHLITHEGALHTSDPRGFVELAGAFVGRGQRGLSRDRVLQRAAGFMQKMRHAGR